MTHPSDPQDPFKFRPHGPWVVLETGEVVSYYDTRGNVEVVIQDQFTPPLDQRFSQVTGTSTVAVETAVEDTVVTVADGTEFTAGERFVLFTTSPPAVAQAFYNIPVI